MIYVYLHGGLANQMFMYATGYTFAKNHNDNLIIDTAYYDLCKYTHINSLNDNRRPDNIRTYRLNEFNLIYKDTINYSNKITNLNRPQEINFSEYFSIIRKEFMSELYEKVFLNIHEVKDFKFNKEKIYIRGQLQDYSFFNKYREELKKEFTFINLSNNIDTIKNWIKTNSPIMLHVRRADYCYFKGGWCLDKTYYDEAVQYIRSNINAPILVFSDDYDYCKNNLKYENIHFACDFGSFTDYEEMYFMTLCRHFIMANSTFSWWGTYLGEKHDSIICCPLIDIWNEKFYPINWHKIKTNILTNDINTSRKHI